MMQKLGTWRTSKLIGLNVYNNNNNNNNNEKIGDINELITDASGKIDVVVIGVGGFLGIGERNVSLPLNQVKFVMEPRSANTASTSTTPGRPRLERARPSQPPPRQPWRATAAIPIMPC